VLGAILIKPWNFLSPYNRRKGDTLYALLDVLTVFMFAVIINIGITALVLRSRIGSVTTGDTVSTLKLHHHVEVNLPSDPPHLAYKPRGFRRISTSSRGVFVRVSDDHLLPL
jgi:hypothetical protein